MKIIDSILICFLFICFSGSAYAGFFNLTMFSRANCATFNESVSWDGWNEWRMEVESDQMHADGRRRGFIDRDTGIPRNRAWAGCLFCGISGWTVYGTHYLEDKYTEDESYMNDVIEFCADEGGAFVESGTMVDCKKSFATNCNLTEW